MAANWPVADIGLVRQAMALKVKYRRPQSDGKWKTRIGWDWIGAHPSNRGGTFPSGLSCKSLGKDIMGMGVAAEEADHMGVVVEAVPQSRRDAAVAALPKLVPCLDEYNKKLTKNDPLLEGCFPDAFVVQFACLSHTHFSFVMKAWRGRASWNIPPVELPDGNTLQLCDSDGRLTFDFLAKHANGEEFVWLSGQGLLTEVLSHMIEIEEPMACSLISRALNMKNECVLGTTEMQALDCLTGQISFQMSQNMNKGVSFEVVRAAVAAQLDTMADDPDLIELFDFVISIGAGNEDFISEIKAWASRFVDQKRRRMRLAGFKVLNDMSPGFPRAKVAALKYTYKGTPKHGYVPCPDAKWSSSKPEQLYFLEQALRYLHHTCRPSIDALPSAFDQDKFLASVDCSLAAAFLDSCKTPADVPICLARANDKLRVQLHCQVLYPLGPLQRGPEKPAMYPASLTAAVAAGEVPWKHAPPTTAAFLKDSLPKPNQKASDTVTDTHGTTVLATVLRFDPVTGEPVNAQTTIKPDTRDGDGKAKSAVTVEWEEWIGSDQGQSTSQHEEAQSIIFTAMQAVLHSFVKHMIPVDMMFHEHTKRVVIVARRHIEKGELMIPPWVSTMRKLSCDKKYELDANAITAYVRARRTVEGTAQGSAVAEPAAQSVFIDDDRHFVEWTKPDDPESSVEFVIGDKTRLHPFWYVEKLSAVDAAKVQKRINCKYTDVVLSDVILGAFKEHNVSSAHELLLPFITNTDALVKGETLVLEKFKKRAIEQQPLTWRDSVKRAKTPGTHSANSTKEAKMDATRDVHSV